MIQHNPCEGVTRPTTETARERVLSDHELALVWRGAEDLGFPFGPIVRTLILTAQRRDEVGGIVWDELDLDRALWTLPAVRSKIGASTQSRLPRSPSRFCAPNGGSPTRDSCLAPEAAKRLREGQGAPRQKRHQTKRRRADRTLDAPRFAANRRERNGKDWRRPSCHRKGSQSRERQLRRDRRRLLAARLRGREARRVGQVGCACSRDRRGCNLMAKFTFDFTKQFEEEARLGPRGYGRNRSPLRSPRSKKRSRASRTPP